MKRLLTIVLLSFVMMAVQAQKWEKKQVEGDELLGTETMTTMQYTDSIGSFVYAKGNYQFIVPCQGDSFFNYEFNRADKGVMILVGMYDDDNNLIEKFKMWLRSCDDSRVAQTWNRGTMSNPVGQKGKVKKILNHLKSNNGYVRIIADRYKDSNFDFKIPHQ